LVLPNFISMLISVIVICKVVDTKLYYGRIIPTCVVITSFGIGIIIATFIKRPMSINKNYLKYALKISVPLVFHGLALTILSQADRTMITAIRGEAETGIYGLIYNFSMIALVITTAFDGTWVPWFTNKMNNSAYEEINQISKKCVMFITLAMIGVVLISPEIIKILSPSMYWEGISIVPPLVMSNFVIFAYTLFVNIEHYYKKTVYISIFSCIAAFCNIILNVYFIESFGYKGAAYTTLISYILSFVLHSLYAKFLNKELYSIKIFILPAIAILGAIISFYVYIDRPLVRWMLVFVSVIVVAYKERKLLIRLLLKNHKTN